MADAGFDDVLQQVLEQEAAAQGVSVETYVREAALIRLVRAMDGRRDTGLPELLEHLRGTGLAATPASDPDDPVTAAVSDPDRLRALESTGLLDSPSDEGLDRVVRLAAEALNAPTAAVSLVSEHRQFFKSAVGLSEAQAKEGGTGLERSMCQYAVATGEPLVIEDAREHPVLGQNRSVLEDGLVAYVGIPLTTTAGHTLGTLCVWDTEPRQWTTAHVQILEDLARLIVQRLPD